MKFTNLTKLIIRFLGGGKIDFPTSNLREVEIEPFDGEGGSSVDLTTLEYDDVKSYYIDFLLRVKNNNELLEFMGSHAFEFVTDTDDYLKNNIVFPDTALISTGQGEYMVADDLYFAMFSFSQLQSGNSWFFEVYSYNNLEVGKYYVLSNGFIIKYTGDPEIDEQNFSVQEITALDGNTYYLIQGSFG